MGLRTVLQFFPSFGLKLLVRWSELLCQRSVRHLGGGMNPHSDRNTEAMSHCSARVLSQRWISLFVEQQQYLQHQF